MQWRCGMSPEGRHLKCVALPGRLSGSMGPPAIGWPCCTKYGNSPSGLPYRSNRLTTRRVAKAKLERLFLFDKHFFPMLYSEQVVMQRPLLYL